MKIFTKELLKGELCDIRDRGWIETGRSGNDGGVGNTLEDLLGIEENNLPLPNAGEWELKAQRADTASLITLFHMEPSPTALKIVPAILLPKYGWPHIKAGIKYPATEKSFRQTLTAGKRTNRGFTVMINRERGRVEVSFDYDSVDETKHDKWRDMVEHRAGTGDLNPNPYWGFDDLFHKAGTKLHKTIYAIAKRKREDGKEYFHYTDFLILQDFSRELFIDAIDRGTVLVDFDARTGHNHGTKFRLRQDSYPLLFSSVERIK